MSLILDGWVTAVYTKAINADKHIMSHFWMYCMCNLSRSSNTAPPLDGAEVSLENQEGRKEEYPTEFISKQIT